MFDAKHYGQAFDVSLDGKRFLMTRPSQSATDQVTVVLNWVEELRRRSRLGNRVLCAVVVDPEPARALAARASERHFQAS